MGKEGCFDLDAKTVMQERESGKCSIVQKIFRQKVGVIQILFVTLPPHCIKTTLKMRKAHTYLAVFATLFLWSANAVSQPFFHCSKTLESPYGVCTHISRPRMDYPIRDRELELCQSVGIQWVRSDIDFGNFFGSLTDYDPTIFDNVTKSCATYNQNFLGILTWLGKYPWEDPDYGKLIERLAKTYNNRIGYWESINEVNLFKNANQLIKEYFETLKITYEVLKRENPNNQVLTSGFSETPVKYLTQLAEMGAGNYFDIYNFHSYFKPEGLIPCFQKIKEIMDKYGWDKPVWITECGMHTAQETNNSGMYFEKMLPAAIERLGMHSKSVRIGVLRDPESGFNALTDDEIEAYLGWGKKTQMVALSEIKFLSPKKTPILITTYDEFFPTDYMPDIVEYVRKGGTIVLSGGMPFFYNAHTFEDSWLEKREKGTSLYKSLHMAAKSPKELPTRGGKTPENKSDYEWMPNEKSPARYLTEANLQEGDSLIPFVVAGDEKEQLPIAGIYKLNSDLKGNVIFQTRMYAHTIPQRETEQARRVARIYLISFAYGVDKVFWYNLRSRENDLVYSEDCFGMIHEDFSEKPSLQAYRTLTKLCPEGSLRPILKEEYGIFHASWETPEGKKMHALWNPMGKKYLKIKTDKDTKGYSYLGKELKPSKKFPIDESVTYFEGSLEIVSAL